MKDRTIEEHLESIEAKLNDISKEIEQSCKQQREMKELRDDLGIIAKDVFQAAVVELDEVGRHFDSDDLLQLLKRLLRNVRNINQLLDRMESLVDLADDTGPLVKEAFCELLTNLDQMEQKGYFQFLSELSRIADTVVTSISIEDVKQIRRNIVPLFNTLKNLTRPEVLGKIDSAVNALSRAADEPGRNISAWRLMKELNNPLARQGMAIMVQILKDLAGPNITTKFEQPDISVQQGG